MIGQQIISWQHVAEPSLWVPMKSKERHSCSAKEDGDGNMVW
jgi:hypothetical protein